MTATTAPLALPDATGTQQALADDPAAWPADPPAPGEVDAAGIQLLVAALKAGFAPPPHIMGAPAVTGLWRALCLDDIADGPLGAGAPAPQPESLT
ncbi:hypothetical protein [Pseudoroseicyclus tamaricis]|uniref:Uncharacterized protein n=1 Tax=Pseudoroseicyclus tamaricis TaxID=2705421 RepID=A0A6B2JGK0_9RHOB|nr:hypothetical protein [Pseudoroseicyclus tamaricis]NDV00321.1 hypothetical protein [Pseudoroseicyclus tamaricis]